jgi:signal transduction histidine kinase
MLISDDGIGFDHEGPTHRNGVKNLKSRVEKWKGTIGISSRPGEGTEIEIILPFSD